MTFGHSKLVRQQKNVIINWVSYRPQPPISASPPPGGRHRPLWEPLSTRTLFTRCCRLQFVTVMNIIMSAVS